MASTYLTKTPSASNRKTFTISCWVKRSSLTVQQAIFTTGNGNSGPLNFFGFGSSDNFNYWEYQDGYTEISDIKTNRVFRDTNAWYHLVLAVDTTQATASDRTKIYVNGELQTSLGTTGSNQYPTSQNQDMAFNQADQHAIGRYEYNNTAYFDGLISHFHFIDGTAYAASDFGSTDSTTGEWKINTAPSVTYGTNGFFLLKDGNSVTDQSGNSNNYTANGTLTNTEDCPSNVFATLNPLIPNTGATFTHGNTNCFRTTGGNYRRVPATLAVSSGKYYAECYIGADQYAGVCQIQSGDIARTTADSAGYLGEHSGDYSLGFRADGYTILNGSAQTSNSGTPISSGTDRLCIALDMDNKKVYLGKNGTWMQSSNPATGTGGYSLGGSEPYTFACATSNADNAFNFGNGYIKDAAISSEGTNASGIGKFEYDVPSGYTALSTKGLNE